MAVLGAENEQGEFEVDDVCYMELPPPPPVPAAGEDRYVCLASGLNLDAKAKVGVPSVLDDGFDCATPYAAALQRQVLIVMPLEPVCARALCRLDHRAAW